MSGNARDLTTGKKILLVEDDEPLRVSLAEQLRLHHEFAITEVGTGSEALAATKDGYFDVLLLDVGLPDMDGRELCRLMRRNNVKSPIIMMGRDTDADQILGLDAGADDYVTKPISLNLLLARLRAQLRQHEQSENAVFTIGPYTFQNGSRILVDHYRDKKIRLTPKQAGILKYLYRSGERVVSREILLKEVWGCNAVVNTHRLEACVYRLRQRIEIDPSCPKLLVTKPDGYCLKP